MISSSDRQTLLDRAVEVDRADQTQGQQQQWSAVVHLSEAIEAHDAHLQRCLQQD